MDVLEEVSSAKVLISLKGTLLNIRTLRAESWDPMQRLGIILRSGIRRYSMELIKPASTSPDLRESQLAEGFEILNENFDNAVPV